VNDNSSALRKSRSWASHPKGYFQPGVLAVTGDHRVLYRWRCRPTRQNVGGAVERPTPEHVWSEVQSRLTGAADEPGLDDAPVLDTKAPPWPLFILMLLAHGWFVRPKVFPLGRTDDKPSANPQAMVPRLLGFAGLWIAAFALLPAAWVSLALAAWVAFVWPGVAQIHREFQNVKDPA
jgi:hypothetical protein